MNPKESSSKAQASPALSSLPSEPPPNPQPPNDTNANPPPPPPELAPLSSPSPSPDKNERFKGIKLPNGWLDCPLAFNQPLRDHRILVCKTPIDDEIAQFLKIPKAKRFAPHTIYTLPNKHYTAKQKQLNVAKPAKRKVGLVIDLTNQKYFDLISFNNGKKTNKVKLRVIAMEDLSNPTDAECLEFCCLVKAFLDSTNNADSYIVVFDDLGFNLCGFMCACFMVNELNYSVDAAVHTFASCAKPGIFEANYIRLLHKKYSDEEDQQIFEQMLKLKPLSKPFWLKRTAPKPTKAEFAVPTKSIRRKRTFSEISQPSQPSKTKQNDTKNTKKTDSFSVISSSSVLSEPTLIGESPRSPKSPQPKVAEPVSSASNIIEEPMLIEPTLIGAPPPPKKQKLSQEEDQREQALKSEHSQHLTSIILQLSKTKDLFHSNGSICRKSVSVPRSSLLGLAKNGIFG